MSLPLIARVFFDFQSPLLIGRIVMAHELTDAVFHQLDLLDVSTLANQRLGNENTLEYPPPSLQCESRL